MNGGVGPGLGGGGCHGMSPLIFFYFELPQCCPVKKLQGNYLK